MNGQRAPLRGGAEGERQEITPTVPRRRNARKQPPSIVPDTLSGFKPLFTAVLNGGRVGRQTKEELSTRVGDWLHERGRLVTEGGRGYLLLDNGAIECIGRDSRGIRMELFECGLNRVESTYEWLVAHLECEAIRRGRPIALSRWARRETEFLAISAGPTHYVQVTADAIDLVRNGTDGIYFAADATYAPWEPAEPRLPEDLKVFRPTFEAPAEVPEYTPEMQQRLFLAWLVALVANVRSLPGAVATGQHGSGKTVTLRGGVKLLLGAGGDVSPVPNRPKDFETVAARRPVCVLDNLDTEPEPWLADLFCAAVTGGTAERRTLYTDSDVSTLPLTAALAVTTRTGLFAARPDVQDRVLPFFFGERHDNADEQELYRELLEQRPAVLSKLARMGFAATAPGNESLPGRFQGFARVVCNLDPFTGAESLRWANRAARLSLGEADPVLAAVVAKDRVLTGKASGIVAELTAEGHDIPYLGGGKSIALRLRELKPALAALGWICEWKPSGSDTIFTLQRKGTQGKQGTWIHFAGGNG